MSKVKDETGNIYGKLTVLERAGSNSCVRQLGFVNVNVVKLLL